MSKSIAKKHTLVEALNLGVNFLRNGDAYGCVIDGHIDRHNLYNGSTAYEEYNANTKFNVKPNPTHTHTPDNRQEAADAAATAAYADDKLFTGVTADKKNLSSKNIYEQEARLLLTSVLNIDINEFYGMADRILTEEEWQKYEDYLKQRKQRKPVSKIIGRRGFWDYEFYTNDEVLDPRADSETLIEAVLEDWKSIALTKPLRIMDLGVGSGCLLLTLLKIFRNARGLAIDCSAEALTVARKNAELLAVRDRVKFKLNNWNDDLDGFYDIIISNPPYVASGEIKNLQEEVKFYDPTLALDGGADGLDCYRYLAKNLKRNLSAAGRIYLEIGCSQKTDVLKIFRENGFEFVRVKNDLADVERVVVFLGSEGCG